MTQRLASALKGISIGVPAGIIVPAVIFFFSKDSSNDSITLEYLYGVSLLDGIRVTFIIVGIISAIVSIITAIYISCDCEGLDVIDTLRILLIFTILLSLLLPIGFLMPSSAQKAYMLLDNVPENTSARAIAVLEQMASKSPEQFINPPSRLRHE